MASLYGRSRQVIWVLNAGSAGKEFTYNVETWVWENPLKKEKATHSSILPGEVHGLYSPWGPKELDTTGGLSLHLNCSSNHLNDSLCLNLYR